MQTQLIARGRIAPVDALPLSIEDHHKWKETGVIVDLFARFPTHRSALRFPLDGRVVTMDADSLRQKSESDVRGEVDLQYNAIQLALGANGDFGELQLFQAFDIGDLSETELWSEHFREHLIAAKPWSLFLAHESLKAPLDRYLRQSPFFRNVFVMMRFQDTKQNTAIRTAISAALSSHGLTAQFADNLTVADTLWDNVCAYMLGSRFGIAVIEEIEERSFNPNVALEIGFMLALQRRVLVLKDKRVHSMPADLIGRIYREFDSYDVEHTISERIDEWIEELTILGDIPRGGDPIHTERGKTILDDDLQYVKRSKS
jgi:hypothetical protein